MSRKSIKMMSNILLTSVLLLGICFASQAKKQLIIIGHQVHRKAATAEEAGALGRNLVEEFEKKYDVEVIYQTYPNPKTQEKLNRLGPLSSCEEDIIHVLNTWAVPRIANFLEPLDSYLESKPIEDFPEDYPPSMVEIGIINGLIYTIPTRVCYSGMFWCNDIILGEQGIAVPSEMTPEEFYEIARKCTFERPTGEKVFGYSFRGTVGSLYEVLCRWARHFGGDLITSDFKCVINQPPAVKALELLQRMYQEGIVPPDSITYDYAEEIKMMQENRVAFFDGNTSYGRTFNDPKKSKIAGHAVMIKQALPQELQASGQHVVGNTSIWGWGILKGSNDKDLAWEYLRFMCSKDSVLSMGLSGTTPARISVLKDPRYLKNNPAATIEAQVAPYVAPVFPAFQNANEVIDVIGEYCHNVIVYGKSAQEEMDKAAEEIQALLP